MSEASLESTDALSGIVALVMGAGNPFGRAAALALAEAGADVALTTATNDAEEALAVRSAARAIAALGRRNKELMLDMSSGTNVQMAVRQITKELGIPSVCVASPDFPHSLPAQRTSEADWARVVGINLGGVFFAFRSVTREVLSLSYAAAAGIRGHLIAIVGVGAGQSAPYLTAKAAVPHLVQALAAEWAPSGIAVNCIEASWSGAEPEPGLIGRVAALTLEIATGPPESGKTFRVDKEQA